MQTIHQLLPLGPVRGQAEYPLACATIEDTPRFGWRGYLLDSARHFIAKTTVLSLLDALAAVKINVFHWHLTDDSAWRLAISKYPQLVTPAGIQGGAYTQAMGYYSASDVREIVTGRADKANSQTLPVPIRGSARV
jgi:hexosaminidase